MIQNVTARNEYVAGVFYRTDSRLDEVPSDIPAGATEVYLQGNRITELKTGTFLNLTQCTKLDIHNNSITTIEDDAYTGMKRLQTLYLYRNKLTFLQKNMFNGLNSLTHLNIEINLIETIPDGCFSDLINLDGLYMSRNKLSEVSGNMWLGLSNLKRLYLYYNKIATLKDGDLNHLHKLEVLLLHGNPLISLSHTIFNSSLYPETDGHPRQIQIGLGTMLCDDRLCWLNQGERLGWITWFKWDEDVKRFYPDCINLPDVWSNVDLNCPHNGMF